MKPSGSVIEYEDFRSAFLEKHPEVYLNGIRIKLLAFRACHILGAYSIPDCF